MKTKGVVTGGGDAPGMNAAIRGIVRIAYTKNFNVVRFERGWEGLLTNMNRLMTPIGKRHTPIREDQGRVPEVRDATHSLPTRGGRL